MKETTQNFQDSKCSIVTVHKATEDIFLIEQGGKEALPAHAKRFKCAHDMLEQHSGKMALTKHVKKMEGPNESHTKKGAS